MFFWKIIWWLSYVQSKIFRIPRPSRNIVIYVSKHMFSKLAFSSSDVHDTSKSKPKIMSKSIEKTSNTKLRKSLKNWCKITNFKASKRWQREKTFILFVGLHFLDEKAISQWFWVPRGAPCGAKGRLLESLRCPKNRKNSQKKAQVEKKTLSLEGQGGLKVAQVAPGRNFRLRIWGKGSLDGDERTIMIHFSRPCLFLVKAVPVKSLFPLLPPVLWKRSCQKKSKLQRQ